MNDFDYTVSLLGDFFYRRKIQHGLSTIWDVGISGWEVWLQVEFSVFLSRYYEGEIEWMREHRLLVDRRKDKERTNLAADFAFRRKGYARDRYIVLEFKQNSSPKQCFSNMLKDVEKVRCARASEMDMRNFWTVGVHPKNPMRKADIKNYLAENANVQKESVATRFIPNTNYAFTVF